MTIKTADLLNQILELTSDNILILNEKFDVISLSEKAQVFLGIVNNSFDISSVIPLHDIQRSLNETIRMTLKSDIEVLIKTLPEATGRNYIMKIEVINNPTNEYVASLNHDFRTPLQSVLGFSQSMIDGLLGDIDPKELKYLGIINKNGKKLLRMLENLFDLSKIECNKFSYNIETFPLKEVVDSIYSEVQEELNKRNILINYNQLNKDKLLIKTDRAIISRVFYNLFDTFIKFNTENTILIEAKVIKNKEVPDFVKAMKTCRESKNYVRINIKDQSINLANEDILNIFNGNITLDTSKATRRYGSVGLGLAFNKKVLNLIDGDIFINLDYTDGLCYSLLIPVTI